MSIGLFSAVSTHEHSEQITLDPPLMSSFTECCMSENFRTPLYHSPTPALLSMLDSKSAVRDSFIFSSFVMFTQQPFSSHSALTSFVSFAESYRDVVFTDSELLSTIHSSLSVHFAAPSVTAVSSSFLLNYSGSGSNGEGDLLKGSIFY